MAKSEIVVRPKGKKCGARKRDGSGTCQLAAGMGTDHVGFGKCKFHGGNSPALKKAAAKEEVAERMRGIGQEGRDITPGIALLEEVRRSAGIVDWLNGVIGSWETQTDEERRQLFMQLGEQGFQKSTWIKLYQDERKHLAQVAKMALDAGVAERQVRLAEEQGQLIAFVIRSVLDDLKLTPEQRAVSAGVVRKHLTLVAERSA